MPAIDRNAVFSDFSPLCVKPWQPAPYSEVTLYLRTGRTGIDHCSLTIRNDRDYLAVKEREEGEFVWYAVRIRLDGRRISWIFNIVTEDGARLKFTRRGFEDTPEDASWWNLVPGYTVPEWAEGAVMYQIFPDRFYNGDPSNDVQDGEYCYLGHRVEKVKDWNSVPETMDVHRFYGGDLEGVIDKLDYLQDLGVEVIYLNPIFVSPSNHKYDAQDYGHVDPHLGVIVKDDGAPLPEDTSDNRLASSYICRTTDPDNLSASDALFAKLVAQAHARGMRVIIDGVFNHCGSFNRFLDRERIYETADVPDKGAYITEDSPYHNYFRFFGGSWPYNGNYDGWWGHDTLPKLNYEGSRDLVAYILGVGRKWVSPPFNADGWRLDVAADLGHSPEFNHWFWKEFRRAVKEANPDAIVLAENYGDSSPWLQGGEWDTIMNYDAFMEPLTWFLTGMEKHSDDYRGDLLNNADHFWKQMTSYWNANVVAQPLFISMNELSNHDHSRFLTRTNRRVGRLNYLGAAAAGEGVSKAVMREAVAVQMTFPGAPTVYYGDEAGVCGFTDPDSRRTYPWGHEDREMIDCHRALIRIHKADACLRTGALRCLTLSYGFAAYGRFDEAAAVVTAVNNNDHPVTETLPVWTLNVPRETEMEVLFTSDGDGFSTEKRAVPVHEGVVTLEMPACGAVILRYRHPEV